MKKPIYPTSLRPWGRFEILEQGPGYWIKKVFVRRGHRASLQSHKNRSEMWIVLSGKIRAIHGSTQKEVKKGEFFLVRKKEKHRFQGITDAVILEVAFGKVSESDIVRYQDDYDRV